MAFVYNWLWPSDPAPMKPTDAAHHEVVRRHFIQALDNIEPPSTFTPRQLAEQFTKPELRQLGYKEQHEVIAALCELAFELREFGDLRIFCRGKEVPEDVLLYDIDGPIRIMARRDL